MRENGQGQGFQDTGSSVELADLVQNEVTRMSVKHAGLRILRSYDGTFEIAPGGVLIELEVDILELLGDDITQRGYDEDH